MKTLMYIPVSPNPYLVEKNKKLIKNSFSFEKAASADLFFELSDDLRNKMAKDFIFEYCLSIAIAEAYDASEVIIPVSLECITEQTKNVGAFLDRLQLLVQIGTLKKIKVTFPGSENYPNSDPISKGHLEKVLSNKNIPFALNIFSGGLDCTVSSTYLEKKGIQQKYLFYDYGQNNIREERLCVERQRISRNIPVTDIYFNEELRSFFDHIKFSTGLLSNKKITLKNKKDEYVPFRNSLLISNAIAEAEKNVTHIVTGSQLDDVNSPDNCPEYYNVWNSLLSLSNNHKHLSILPILFNFGGKKEVVQLGYDLGVDFSQTWTCHNTSAEDELLIQCGNCNDCKVREEAFKQNNLIDPMKSLYSDPTVIMNDLEHQETIIKLIKKIKYSGKDIECDYIDGTLEEVGFDSLMSIHLITLLEEEFAIEIEGEHLINFSHKNVTDINSLINTVKLSNG